MGLQSPVSIGCTANGHLAYLIYHQQITCPGVSFGVIRDEESPKQRKP